MVADRMRSRDSQRLRSCIVTLVVLFGAACGDSPTPLTQAAGVAALPPVGTEVAAQDRGPAAFARCRDLRPTTSAGEFAHSRSAVMARTLPAVHFVQDVVAAPGTTTVVEAKLSYGDIGKDLEDEPVELWLDTCDGIARVGTGQTDDDGRARIGLSTPPRPGEYAVHVVVVGDGSSTRASLWVLEPGTPIVVFDIDGTLTQSDAEVSQDVLHAQYEKIYDGEYIPKIYPDGSALAEVWANKGVLPVYLSGRPYWLSQYSRDWLGSEGFPRGPVHVTDRHRDVVPKIDGVGRFKAESLRRLQGLGLAIEAAYGNAATDVWAYGEVGIPRERTFIIGPHAGDEGTQPVRDAWTTALPWARERPVPKGSLAL